MSTNYSGVVLAKGPVGYWRLGEAVGPTAVDASGFGYDGTYNGNPTFGQPGAIADDPDTAIGGLRVTRLTDRRLILTGLSTNRRSSR